MKKILFVVMFFVSISAIGQDMNVISYNIRFNNPRDSANAWPNRIEMVTSLLRFHAAEIFGLQEALHGQILDIAREMPQFAWLGTGRDDGKQGGEFSPIFYNKESFTLLENGQFWLSETPDIPSKGWDAALPRICSWGKFKRNDNGKEFFLFNTHFDHIGQTARAESALLIHKKIVELSGNADIPVILTGDFNLTPETVPVKLMKQKMHDAFDVTLTPPYGPVGTFNGFRRNHPLDNRIDYIFVNDHVKVHRYGALTDAWENRWPSDHLPVLVTVSF